ncbi:hypothetical protein D3C77_558010 [compost metagenome]
MSEKQLTDRSELYLPPFMKEQIYAKLRFQLKNLSANSRLRYVKSIRGLRHMLQLRNLNEIQDLPQFHSAASPPGSQ